MQAPKLKPCPFCKEQIRAEAVKCRFCGEWLEQPIHSIPASIKPAPHAHTTFQADSKVPSNKATEGNPYAGYRDLSSLTQLVRNLSIVGVTIEAVAVISCAMQLNLFERSYSVAEANTNDVRQMMVAGFELIWFLLTAIVFGRWIYRANSNVRALGATGLMANPAWAVAYFFIPIFNLWKPYQVMKELWKSGQNPLTWQKTPSSPIVEGWGALYILSAVFGIMSAQAWAKAHTALELQDATGVQILSHLTNIGLWVISAVFVSKICSAQTRAVKASAGKSRDAAQADTDAGTRAEDCNPILYAGFWVRLGAYALDALILLPVIALELWGSIELKYFYAYAFIPNLLLWFFYWMWLVKRYGGTFGKLKMGIGIRKPDGNPVGYREACLRILPSILVSFVLSFATNYPLWQLSDSDFSSLSYLERSKYAAAFSPVWFFIANLLMWAWSALDFSVFFLNPKRRALHDFIAGTVVVYAKPLSKTKAKQDDESNQTQAPQPIFINANQSNAGVSKKYNCPCQHCGGHIEFEAARLLKNETRLVACPHCEQQTRLFLPSAPATKSRVFTNLEIAIFVLVAAAVFVTALVIYSNPASKTSEGKGVPNGYSELAKSFRKAADQGNADAQDTLGQYYYYGLGVPQDYSEAAKWYRKAAEQGNVDAEVSLGICYDNGQGVTQDYDEAVKWFRAAAEQGNQWGQYDLGLCYQYGQGVSKNYTIALMWFRKAAAAGNTKAQKQIQVLEPIIQKEDEMRQQQAQAEEELRQREERARQQQAQAEEARQIIEQAKIAIRERWRRLNLGMRPASVSQLLGKPDNVDRVGDNNSGYLMTWWYKYHDADEVFGYVSFGFNGTVNGWTAP